MKKNLVSRTLAKEIASSMSELKAVDIKALDLSGIASFTDFFIVCSGTSKKHVQSIADRIVADQKKKGHHALGVEGHEKGEWTLVDYGNVVAHVFYPDARLFYNIERFWGDAKRVRFKSKVQSSKSKTNPKSKVQIL